MTACKRKSELLGPRWLLCASRPLSGSLDSTFIYFAACPVSICRFPRLSSSSFAARYRSLIDNYHSHRLLEFPLKYEPAPQGHDLHRWWLHQESWARRLRRRSVAQDSPQRAVGRFSPDNQQSHGAEGDDCRLAGTHNQMPGNDSNGFQVFVRRHDQEMGIRLKITRLDQE